MATRATNPDVDQRERRLYAELGDLTPEDALQQADDLDEELGRTMEKLRAQGARLLSRPVKSEAMLAQVLLLRRLGEASSGGGSVRESVPFEVFRSIQAEAWVEADDQVRDAVAEARERALVAAEEAQAQAAEPPGDVVMREAKVPLGRAIRHAWHCRRVAFWIGSAVILRFAALMKLGGAWFAIRPFMDAVGKALIFGSLLKASSTGSPALNFLLPLTGILAFRLFERGAFYATRSLIRCRKIAKKIDIPLFVVPFGYSARPLIDFVAYSVILAAGFGIFWAVDGTLYLQLGPQLLIAAAGLVLALLFAWSIGLWLSVLNAKAQDTRLTIRYVLEFWLYATPVLYPLSLIPESIRPIAYVNPMTAPVEMVKYGLLGVDQVDLLPLVSTIGFTILFAVSGAWFFNSQAAKSLHGALVDPDEDDEGGMM